MNAVRNTGKFIGAILAEPKKYNSKMFCVAMKFYSLKEMIAIMSKAMDKTIIYEHISHKEFKKSMTISEVLTDMFVEMLAFLEETYYFF